MKDTTIQRNRFTFGTEKQPAIGSRDMVDSNHPLASAADAEMLAAGGNAIDAAVATQFAFTMVETIMVSLIGGGTTHMDRGAGAGGRIAHARLDARRLGRARPRFRRGGGGRERKERDHVQ